MRNTDSPAEPGPLRVHPTIQIQLSSKCARLSLSETFRGLARRSLQRGSGLYLRRRMRLLIVSNSSQPRVPTVKSWRPVKQTRFGADSWARLRVLLMKMDWSKGHSVSFFRETFSDWGLTMAQKIPLQRASPTRLHSDTPEAKKTPRCARAAPHLLSVSSASMYKSWMRFPNERHVSREALRGSLP